MAQQWIRRIGLEIEGMHGSTDLAKLRIRFICHQAKVESPAPGEFRIYNLSKESASKLISGAEGKKLTLTAGYNDNAGVIYKGDIVKAQAGRENPTDTFVDIYTRGAERAYNRAVINKTFSAGSTQEDHVKEVLKMMEPFGIKKGEIKGLSQTKYTRAVSLYGMARELMRMLSFSNDGHWYINPRDYTLNFLPNNDQGTGGDFVLNANTGLIGMPVQQQDGSIIATALINPAFDLHKRVIIDEKSIQRMSWSVNWGDQASQEYSQAQSGLTDGVYRIEGIEWRGDTHETEWYATLILVGAITGGTPSSTLRNITYTTNHGEAAASGGGGS